MADEVNTTQGTAAPAVGTPQAAPEAAPTQEQQNAFQRFLGSLFGGRPSWRPQRRSGPPSSKRRRGFLSCPRRSGPRRKRTPRKKRLRTCGHSCCSATLRTPP